MPAIKLKRRGIDLGSPNIERLEIPDPLDNWSCGKAVYLPAICAPELAQRQQDVDQSSRLYQAIIDRQECDALFDQAPYVARLEPYFESLGSSVNQGDQQEIETVLFDAIEQGACVAEDIWVKVSWLSFHEKDASLRFRCSFGEDFVEDVAADPKRQRYAATLSDALFPESSVITENPALLNRIEGILGSNTLHFVERIIYFNSPNGGAYLHHDRERGHAGVVYAQITGRTFWLALPKQALMEEVQEFIKQSQANGWPTGINQPAREELNLLAQNKGSLSEQLETFSNTSLIQLINETAEFIQQLVVNGHSRLLAPGDALLLPQTNEMDCCWHSVCCVGDETGEALSFAIRSEG